MSAHGERRQRRRAIGRAERATVRLTGIHSEEWIACGVRWAKARWLLDDETLVAGYIGNSTMDKDPTAAVDQLAAHYDLNDPFSAQGCWYGRPLPNRSEFQP